MSKRYFSGFPDTKDVVTVSVPMPEVPEIKLEIPQIPDAPEIEEFKEFEFISLTVEQIKKMSNDELKAVLSREYQPEKILPMSLQSLIVCELDDRSIKKSNKSHWIKTHDFWFGVITIILTAIGVWIAYQSLISQNKQSDSPAVESDDYQKSQKSQEKPSQSPATSQAQQIPQQKTSDALPHELDHPESLKTHKQEISAQEQKKTRIAIKGEFIKHQAFQELI